MNKSHGLSNTRLYRIWENMLSRCYRVDHTSYERYGGKGVIVCDEWKTDFMSFYRWALENGYESTLTIDRIDNNKGYSPNNCRWVTIIEQNKNRNHTPRKAVIKWTIDGVTKTAKEWCNETNILYPTAKYRIDKMGMTPKEALQGGIE